MNGMVSRAALLFCLTAVFLLLSHVQVAAQDVPQPCMLAIPGSEKVIDLTSLNKPEPYKHDAHGYTFYYNFCSNFERACQGKDYIAVMSNEAACFGLGTYYTVNLQDASDPKKGVHVKFKGGDYVDGAEGKHETRITFNMVCDETSTQDPYPDFKYISEDLSEEDGKSVLTFYFAGKTAKACPVDKPIIPSGNFWGWGIGATVLTIFCVSVFAYFVIGTLVRKVALKKSGTDVIPQFAFWKDFPFLLKDGVMLIVDCFKSIVLKRSKYQDISD